MKHRNLVAPERTSADEQALFEAMSAPALYFKPMGFEAADIAQQWGMDANLYGTHLHQLKQALRKKSPLLEVDFREMLGLGRGQQAVA